MEIPPEIKVHAPGVLGALSALIFLRGPWLKMFGFVCAGWAASHYLTPTLARILGATTEDYGGIGFTTGMLSMALAAKVFEVIAAIEPAAILDRILKRLGL